MQNLMPEQDPAMEYILCFADNNHRLGAALRYPNPAFLVPGIFALASTRKSCIVHLPTELDVSL